MLNQSISLEDENISGKNYVPPLQALYLYISGSCNLACRHCWITPNFVGEGKTGRYIPLEFVNKAIQEALPLGLNSVKLTGGEPTLHPQFREMLTSINEVGIRVTMETNATLIDADLANFLAGIGNLSFVSVSLDGADAETHESLRMVPGSFNKAIEGIRNLVNIGKRPQLICTLYKGNVAQIRDIINLALELNCSSIKFNHLQKTGRGESLAKHEGISVGDLIGIYHRIADEFEPEFGIPIYFDIPCAFLPLKKLLYKGPSLCHVLNILGMLSGGELSLCGIGETKSELIYGNIAYDSLAEIWNNSVGLIKLRETVPYQLDGICKKCLHSYFCMGACVANSYHETGKLNSAYFFCAQADAEGFFPASRLR
jgi:SynChlorMet cassette radical SAM/SPASM protein ScmF